MAIKPHDLRLRSKNYYCLLIFSLLTLIFSCKKDFKNAISSESQNDEIAILKSIYAKETSSKTGNKILSSNTVSNGSSLINAKNVRWDHESIMSRSGSKVTEFEVEEDSVFLSPKQFSQGESIRFRNKTSVVFIEKADRSRINFYMKVIEELPEKFGVPEIRNVSYNHIPYNFTGYILYYNLDKTFVNGFKVHYGKVTKSVSVVNSPAGEQTKQVLSAGHKNATEDVCTVEPIYNSWCQWAETTVNDHYIYSFNGCTQNIVGYAVQCRSNPDDGGTPGITGDPNYYPGQYSPNLVNKMTSSVLANPKINCILSKIDDSNYAYNKFLAAFIDNYGTNVTFIVQPVVINPKNNQEVNALTDFNGKSNNMVINLSAKYFNDPSTTFMRGARTIIHEMAHAYIAQKVYALGITGAPLKNLIATGDEDLYDLYASYTDPVTGVLKLDETTPNNDLQHEYMSTSLAYDIAVGLQNFAYSNQPAPQTPDLLYVSIDQYLALAYTSLVGTHGYDLYLASTHQAAGDMWNAVRSMEIYTFNNCGTP